MMLMHYHAVEVHLFELGFSMPPGTLVHAPSLQRADVLFLCLSACRAMIYAYLSIEPEAYVSFSILFCTHMFLAVTTLSKLSLFHAEDWDISIVHSTMDLSTIVDRMAKKAEEASLQYDRLEHNRPWLEISRRMRAMQLQFEKLLAVSNSSVASIPITHAQDGSIATSFDFNGFDLLDDCLWQSLPDSVN